MQDKEIIGDYKAFFQQIKKNLKSLDITIDSFPISHIGIKTASQDEYLEIRDKLINISNSYIENIHNDRPIAKIILKEPLWLDGDTSVSLIELMPPKASKQYGTGIEHIGFVVGDNMDEFKIEHQKKISGIQDQGPYCKPAYIRFQDGYRVKFYEYSLKDVIEMEGNTFQIVS